MKGVEAKDRALEHATKAYIFSQIGLTYLKVRKAMGVKNSQLAHQEGEENLIEFLNRIGCKVEIDDSEMPIEEIQKQRTIFYANHQRSGFETFLIRGVVKKPVAVVMKDEIADKKIVGEMQVKTGAIFVPRGDLDFRSLDVSNLAHLAVDALMSGGGVFIFPEGTKSESGEICGDWKKGRGRRQWAKTLDSNMNYLLGSGLQKVRKVGVIFDLHNLVDRKIESDPFKAKLNLKSGIRIKLIPLDGKSMDENWQEYDDERNVFGSMRKALLNFQSKVKDELIEEKTISDFRVLGDFPFKF